jgi:hypothetical protein
VELRLLPIMTAVLYNIPIELSVPMKLARLIKMCFKETCSLVCTVNMCLVHLLFKSRQEKRHVLGNFSFRGSATSYFSAFIAVVTFRASVRRSLEVGHYVGHKASKDRCGIWCYPLRSGHIVTKKGCRIMHDTRICSVCVHDCSWKQSKLVPK